MKELTPDTYAKLYQDIVELRKTFLLPVGKHAPLDQEELTLHEKVFRSEFRELCLADSPIMVLDGLVDGVVTLMGRIVHLGYRGYNLFVLEAPGEKFFINELIRMADLLGFNFEGGWDEIHASNLSKVCKTQQDLKKTQVYYNKLGVKTYAEETGGGWVVKVAEDFTDTEGNNYPKGKFLKSVSYKKPDLTPFV